MTSPQRLAGTPPGPELAVLLEELDPDTLPATDAVTVLKAWSRQRAHDHARFARTLARVGQLTRAATGPLDGDWAGAEIAAALTWTDSKAGHELEFADTLLTLPLVRDAFEAGRIDHGKAWVFTDVLGAAQLTGGQIGKVCGVLVPVAPRLTTGQLRHRLLRAVLTVDPDYTGRRYRRALTRARVHGYLTADGTAVITATGLAADEAAAACARVDAVAEQLHRGGHPGSINQIRTRVFVQLLDGRLTGLTHDEIITTLLASAPADTTDTDTTAADTAADSASTGTDSTGRDSTGRNGDEMRDAVDLDTATSAEGAVPTDPAPADDHATDHSTDHSTSDGDGDGDGVDPDPPDHPDPPGAPTGPHGSGDPPPPVPPGSAEHRPVPRGPAGVEIRVGLLTLLGLDTRPGEIPGWGPVLPEVARTLTARQHHGEWRYALLDDDGHLLLAGTTPARPTTGPDGGATAAGGVVEIHVTVSALAVLHADHHPGWAALITSLTGRWARRDHLHALLDAHPDTRFARGPLARHIQIRDRTCIAPGCRRPATACHLDHTLDHACGGETTHANTGPLCPRHHLLKHQGGWQLQQPLPGRFRWTSPLGQVYDTRGEPLAPPLPDPVVRTDDDETPDPDESLSPPAASFNPWRPRPAPAPPPPTPRRPSPWTHTHPDNRGEPPPF